MNAVERLEAAIVKLEALKTESTGETWFAHAETITTPLHDPEVGSINAWVTESEKQADTDLIVTLHRTIAAHLGVLREGQREAYRCGAFPTDVLKAALALADAILGGDPHVQA